MDLHVWLLISLGITAAWVLVGAVLTRIARHQRAEDQFWSTYDD